MIIKLSEGPIGCILVNIYIILVILFGSNTKYIFRV